MCKELATRNVGGEFYTHCALKVLLLLCPVYMSGFDFPTACDELVRRMIAKLPRLTRLCLNEWTGISEANVSDVIRNCLKLRELRLVGVPVGDGHAVVTRPSTGRDSWRVVVPLLCRAD